MRVGQTSIVVFASKLVASALGFVTTIYFARVLGAEVLGYYALTVALVQWLKLGGSLGINGAMTKRISEGTDRAGYATAGAVMIGAFGLTLSAVVLLAGPYVERYVGRPVTAFVILLLLLGLGQSTVNAVLQGQRSVHISGLLDPIKVSTISGTQLLLVLTGMELPGLLIGHAVGWLSVILLGAKFIEIGIGRPTWQHFSSIFDYAKYSWFGGLKNRTFNDIDVLILGVFVPAQLVGIYSVAWKIASFLMTFDAAISQTIFPEISNASADDRAKSVSGLVNEALRFGGLILIPGLVGGAILSERLLRIYSPEFTQGTSVLVILILSTLLYGYQRQLLTSLNAVDRPDIAFRVNVALVGFNTLANVALVLVIGWVGAAVATALSAALGALLAYRGLRKLVEFSVPYVEISRQVGAALFMGVAVYGALWVENAYRMLNHNAALVVTLVTLGAAIYFVILFVLSSEFRDTVKQNLFTSV